MWRCQKDREGADRHKDMLPVTDKEARKKNACTNNKVIQASRQAKERMTPEDMRKDRQA